jgi:Helix-turn-helix domain
MNERNALIKEYFKNECTKSELARQYGVSRKTVHKWIRRFKENGAAGLEELSRAHFNFVRLLPTRSPLRGLCLFSFVFYKYATPTGFSVRHSTNVQHRIRDAAGVTYWH